MTVNVNFSDDEPLEYLANPKDPRPPDKVVQCRICQGPLTVRHFWVVSKWLRATVHQRCLDRWESEHYGGKKPSVEVPERFAHFDLDRFPHKHALEQCANFGPDSRYKSLVLVGLPGTGKSRLLWETIRQFFDLWHSDRGQTQWVEYFLFSDLISEYDQSKIRRLKSAPFVFIDDLRDFPPGRVKAQVQESVRYRIQSGKWTFLTVDDTKFDPDLLKHVCIGRAAVVTID